MKKRQWSPEKKALIVIQGLKGTPVSEICNEHQISQAQYYQWRDQFLNNASKTFEVSSTSRKEARMEREIHKLRALVGELTLELKKSDEVFG